MRPLDDKKPVRNFSQVFKKANKLYRRVPVNGRAYSRWGYRMNDPLSVTDFTIEEIKEIIRSGDLESLRELSRFYYRTNSAYRANIDFLAHLSLYDYFVIPAFEEGSS